MYKEKTPERYEGGETLHWERRKIRELESVRPVIGREEVGKLATVGRTESNTEIVTFTAVSSEMAMKAREKGCAV